jgi:hypothetical protein
MKTILTILSVIALLSCEPEHSKEYYDAVDNYNKAKIESDKADSLYIQAVKEYELKNK